jgi:hypothetical protein
VNSEKPALLRYCGKAIHLKSYHLPSPPFGRKASFKGFARKHLPSLCYGKQAIIPPRAGRLLTIICSRKDFCIQIKMLLQPVNGVFDGIVQLGDAYEVKYSFAGGDEFVQHFQFFTGGSRAFLICSGVGR